MQEIKKSCNKAGNVALLGRKLPAQHRKGWLLLAASWSPHLTYPLWKMYSTSLVLYSNRFCMFLCLVAWFHSNFKETKPQISSK